MDYELVRSRRKSLAVSVEDGRVIVRSPLWMPRRLIDAFVARHSEWIDERLARHRELAGRYYLLGELHSANGVDVEAAWRRVMEDMVVPRAWEMAKELGFAPKAIRISRAKRRWGSCSAKGNINLSLRLAQLPPSLIDYVILHELCHLHHHDHSKAFWALVERHMGDYKERREALRRFW